MSDEHVEFENDRVRVSRVTVPPRARHEGKQRGDRIVVHLTDAQQVRKQDGGQDEQIRHKAGDTVWREASRQPCWTGFRAPEGRAAGRRPGAEVHLGFCWREERADAAQRQWRTNREGGMGKQGWDG